MVAVFIQYELCSPEFAFTIKGMGRIRTGTVGFSYRDWMGIFYPQGAPVRRQLGIYLDNFDTCELTQFTHQMPDPERMTHFAAQLKGDAKMFVRIHNAFTHCADVGMALSMARHFRRALEPLYDAGKLGGLIGPFPYAFKNTPDRRDYLQELASVLRFGSLPLQLDFRHPSWTSEESLQWLSYCGLGVVLVDEPSLPGLVPALSKATSSHVVVRFHGRNAGAWWSGNATTRHDYSYSVDELEEMAARYAPLVNNATEITFLFQNHWQAQAIRNAMQWKEVLMHVVDRDVRVPTEELLPTVDDDSDRPPATLSLSEVKMRVSREFSGIMGARAAGAQDISARASGAHDQPALDLPPRNECLIQGATRCTSESADDLVQG